MCSRGRVRLCQHHDRLVEGAVYRVTGSIVRADVSRFPQGWGARSGKPYTTHYVRAASATKAENKGMNSSRLRARICSRALLGRASQSSIERRPDVPLPR